MDSSPNPARISLDLRDRMTDFSEQELLVRLNNFEDHFVERKSTGDNKDWLKTVVAFANSVPIGYSAVLFIGVKNSGEIEGTANLDTLQQKFSKTLDEVYPPIYCTAKIVSRDGKQCLAVIIPGSEERPHFSGHAFVRNGSKSIKASEDQFDKLLAERNGVAYELRRWIGKTVTMKIPRERIPMFHGAELVGPFERTSATVIDCNKFFVSVDLPKPRRLSFPLRSVVINFDHEQNCLELQILQL